MILRSEAEVDKMVSELVQRTKGKYVTQGVAFNKNSEKQLRLLKLVLMESDSFSGFIKDLLMVRYLSSQSIPIIGNNPTIQKIEEVEEDRSIKNNMDDWV